MPEFLLCLYGKNIRLGFSPCAALPLVDRYGCAAEE